MSGIRVETSAWPLIQELLDRGMGAVLPIGAACKEHGRHLPMNTDQRQVDWIVERLVQEVDLVVWPTITYGYYPVFVDYPGSVSLSERTFVAMLGEVIDGIEHAGAVRVILLNTGISTIPPLQQVIATRPEPSQYQIVNVYSGPLFNREVEELAEQQWGGHADEIETSMMLAIDADAVDMSRAQAAPGAIERGRFNRHDPSLPNYSPDGVNGDPSLATREKGERLVGAMMADIFAALRTN